MRAPRAALMEIAELDALGVDPRSYRLCLTLRARSAGHPSADAACWYCRAWGVCGLHSCAPEERERLERRRRRIAQRARGGGRG